MALESNSDDVRIDTTAMLAAVWRKKLRIIAVTIGLLVVTYVLLMFTPRLYESSASLLIEARDNTFLRATNGVASSGGVADDSEIASQIELIQSRDAMVRVMDMVDLRNQPEFTETSKGLSGLVLQMLGRTSTPKNLDAVIVANLQSRLTVVRERNSQLISILFRSQSPQLSADIANAIAETHLNRRTGVLIEDTADASKWLATEIDKLRARVSEAEAKVASYRVDNDLFVGGNNTSLLDQQLSDISAQIVQAQERKSTAQSRVTVLRSLMQAGESIEGIAAVRDSAAIQRLGDEKGRLQSERAQRLATLLPNHPEVMSLTAQVNELDKEIIAEGRRVADALDAEARIEAGVEQSLRDELVRLKIAVSGATKNTVTLNELEREAKAQRDLLETYLLRYRDASARTDSSSAIPNIRIVGVAAPSYAAVSPKTNFVLAAVLISSLVAQVGQILFSELLSGRALVENTNSAFRRTGSFSRETEYGTQNVAEVVRSSTYDEGFVQPAPVSDYATLDEPADTEMYDADAYEANDGYIETTHPEVGAWQQEVGSILQGETALRDEEAYAAAYETEPTYDVESHYEAEPSDKVNDVDEDDLNEAYTAGSNTFYVDDPDTSFEVETEPFYASEPEAVHESEMEAGSFYENEVENEFHAANEIARSGDDLAVHRDSYSTTRGAVEIDQPFGDHPFEAEDRAFDAEPTTPVSAPAAVSVPASEIPSEPMESAELSSNKPQVVSDGPTLPAQLLPLCDAIGAAEERIVFVGTLDSETQGGAIVELLRSDASNRGISVAVVDASSGEQSAELGLTDLCAGHASFGEVIYRHANGIDAWVPWGQQAHLDRTSDAAVTLAQALSDVFELVIISYGPAGSTSNLSAFSGVEGYVLLVAPSNVDDATFDDLHDNAAALGFDRVQLVPFANGTSQVA